MDEKLLALREVSRQIRSNRIERQNIRAKCLQWNWWARQQTEYYQWAYEQAYTPKDLKAYADLGEPVIYEWDEGAAYYAHRRLIYHDLEILWHKESELLQYLWQKTDTRKRYVYNLDVIAAAHESTENYMYKRMRKFDWFKKRNDIPGKKTHNTYLKLVENI